MIGTQISQLLVERFIASGGMGDLYLAHHRVAGIYRAVKFLRRELSANPVVVARFVQEAKACISVRHKNLVSVYDVGQLAENGQWYLVMDYLGDMTLSRFIHERGAPIPFDEAIRIARGICDGLDAAHARGLIHRDLKPDNILIVDGNPVIIDWGIAKQLTDDTSGMPLTRTDAVMGTPAYMSPEQMRDTRSAGRSADIWAVACIAYQMLTGGWLPYQREPTAAYYMLSTVELHRRIDGPPIDPREHVPSIPASIVRVLFAALAPDPAKRIQSAGELIARLDEAASIADVPDIDLLETARSPTRRPPPTHLESPGNDNAGTISKYQLGAPLGEGGMADVFLATIVGEEGFKRTVAVKRVKPEYAMHPLFGPMFVSEARVASRLHHANIVSVLDFERDAAGRLFLVMEYVDGKSLVSLANAGQVPFSATIYVIAEVLRALAYAHDLPDTGDGITMIVHRDVSPHNILISWEGAVKLSDFGIAKARGVGAETQTGSGVKGKVAYMAPEQANAKRDVDGRLDLYAVGIVLWELLTGQQLYTGDTNAIFAAILIYDTPLPTSVRKDIPRDLEAVVMILLAKNPDERYQTASEALAALLACEAAPKDGKGEIAALLGKRFPSELRTRGRGDSAPGDGAVRVAAQLTVPAPNQTMVRVASTTLDGAASQSVAQTTRRRAAWIAFVGLGTAAIAAGAVFAIGRVARSSARDVDVEASHSISHDTTSSTDDGMVVTATRVSDARMGSVGADAISTDAQLATTHVDALKAEASHVTASVVDASVRDAAQLATHVIDAAKTNTPHPAPDTGSAHASSADSNVPTAKGWLGVVVEGSWAEVFLDGRSIGQTALHVQVPVGRHSVRVKNDTKEKTFTVTVTASKPTDIHETW